MCHQTSALTLQWLVCFCSDLLECFSFRRDMPWHAVWLPFDFQSHCVSVCVCVCVCVAAVLTLCCPVTQAKLPCGVCLLNVRPTQQDRISWISHENVAFFSPWFSCASSCLFSFSLPFHYLSSAHTHTHTHTHTLTLTLTQLYLYPKLNQDLKKSCVALGVLMGPH